MRNLYADEKYAGTVKELKRELTRLREEFKVPEDTTPVKRLKRKPKKKKKS